MLGCHCRGAMQRVPLLGCHCCVPLRETIARKNWPECYTVLRCPFLCIDNTQKLAFALSGVYAGIIWGSKKKWRFLRSCNGPPINLLGEKTERLQDPNEAPETSWRLLPRLVKGLGLAWLGNTGSRVSGCLSIDLLLTHVLVYSVSIPTPELFSAIRGKWKTLEKKLRKKPCENPATWWFFSFFVEKDPLTFHYTCFIGILISWLL